MAQLSKLGKRDLQIKRAATLPVMSIMGKFPEHKRTSERRCGNTVRRMMKEKTSSEEHEQTRKNKKTNKEYTMVE